MAKKVSQAKNDPKSKRNKPQKIRVLIVEDREDDVLPLIRRLNKGGYNPICERVDTTAAMKKALKEKQWDLILCDYKIPDFGAPLAIALLKKTKIDIPVIIVSGDISEEKAIECMRLGANDYLMKSSLSRLCPAVARELKEAKIRKRQKRTEEKLHREEQLFRTLKEQSSDIFVLVNSEGKVVYENPAVEVLLGLKVEERIGQNVFEMVHPDDLRDIKDAFIKLFKDKNLTINRKREVRLRHRDGSWRTFEVAASNLVNNNVMEVAIVNLRDITERKQAEDALRASEEKFAKSFRYSPNAMCISTIKDGRYVEVNNIYLKMFGYEREEIIGRTSSEICLWVDIADRAAMVEAINRTGKVADLKLQLRDKQGGIHWGLTSGSLIQTKGETYLLTQTIDITEQKLAEEKLRKSEELYTKLVKSLPDVVIQTDLEGNIVFVNDKALQIGDYSREEIEGHNLITFVASEDQEKAIKDLQRVREGSSLGTVEYNLLAKDGRKIPFDVNGDALRNEEGKPFSFVCVCRDISERKRAEQVMREQDELLRDINKNLPGVIYQFYAKDSGEYGMSYISEPLAEFSKIMVSDDTASLDTFFSAFLSPLFEQERDRFLASIKKAVETVTPWNFEGRIAGQTGKMLWFHGLSIPKRLEDVVIFNGILLNITERKLAEEKSRQSEEKFRKIFMTSPNSIGIARLNDGLLIDANKRFEEILGWRREEVIGIKSIDWPHNFWVDPSGRDFMVADLKAGQDVINREFKFRRSDGSVRTGIYSARSINIDSEECLIFILQDITERKVAEEKFRKIFMTSPDCIAITRMQDGSVIDANKGLEDILGWGREIVIGKKSTEAPYDFWVDLSARDLMVAELRAGRDILHREFEFRRSDGSVRSGVYSARPINIGDEECLIFILQDLTERKLAEEALLQSEEKYRNIIENIEDGYAELDLKGNFLFVNNALCKIDGYSKNELMKMNYHDIMDEENAKRTYAAYHKVFITGESERNVEYEIITKSGIRKYLEMSVNPIKNDDSRVVAFRGIVRDKTERRLAEEKFYKIFMTTPDCIVISRLKDGLLIDVNKGFEDIVGWEREIVIGKVAIEQPLNLWVDLSAREFMVAELNAGRDVLHREFEFRRRDGSIHTGVYSARTINIEGEASIIFIMQDITGQKRMEKELAGAQKAKLMGQITSGVAHEVRNPLHAIQAISEAMAIDLDEKSDYKDYLMHIKAQVARLSHLMNDLLELGKPIQPSQFSRQLLTDIVDTAMRNWMEAHPHMSEKVKVINSLYADDLVLVDANKIQQVIINLLENAAQHNPQDEEILLELGNASKEYLMVKIVDKGAGLNPQDLPKIFEPFYTTRKSGTGLGLSICKHIVESHGGSIEVVNNEDAPGCTAQFTLPVYNSKEYK